MHERAVEKVLRLEVFWKNVFPECYGCLLGDIYFLQGKL